MKTMRDRAPRGTEISYLTWSLEFFYILKIIFESAYFFFHDTQFQL